MFLPRCVARLVLLLLAGANCGSAPSGIDHTGGIQVLFIGNSLTFQNNLPGMLTALVDSAGAGPIIVESVTFGGWGLQDHWVQGGSREAIARGGWDVVVIQQGPSATEGRPSLLEYSQRYAEEVAAVGARLALYMVWPAAVRDFDFDGVSDSYATAARDVGGLLFPAGEAWRAAWRRDPSIALYGEDDFHPSIAGTYLAALVMFEQLTGRAPRGLPNALEVPGVPPVLVAPAVATVLQEAAEEANAQFALP